MYDYKTELKHLTDTNPDGLHKALLATDLRARNLSADAGVARMDKLMTAAGEAGISDNWGQMAVVDRLAELGTIREVPVAKLVPTQHRLFVWVGV